MGSEFQTVAVAAIAVLAVMTTLWAIGRASANYGLVDLGWAANFAGLAAWLGLGASGAGFRAGC